MIRQNFDIHPCRYCNNPCKGRQCRNCHIKMINNKQGECIDCSKIFNALRINGTKKQRCFDCQSIYTKHHISVCNICGNNYHAILKDGRKFAKCYNCYNEEFTNCKNCNKRCLKKYDICKDCLEVDKHNITLIESKCRNNNCENKTFYCFCKECFKDYRFVTTKF